MFQTGQILLGQYRPVDTFLHRLDARAKILPISVVLVLGLLTESFAFYLVILGALVVALLTSGVTLGRLLINFRPILILVAVTSLYHLVFSGGDSEIWVELGGIRLRETAVVNAAFFSLRLVLFVSIAFLVTFTNSPSELAEAFTRILAPLSRLKIPVQDLSLILFMAIRFIPVLYEEFVAIRNAQIIRGVRFSGSFVARVKKTLSIIIPVFVAALQRADELAMAIEARGYRGGAARTIYSRLRFGSAEWGFGLGTSIIIIGLFYVTL